MWPPQRPDRPPPRNQGRGSDPAKPLPQAPSGGKALGPVVGPFYFCLHYFYIRTVFPQSPRCVCIGAEVTQPVRRLVFPPPRWQPTRVGATQPNRRLVFPPPRWQPTRVGVTQPIRRTVFPPPRCASNGGRGYATRPWCYGNRTPISSRFPTSMPLLVLPPPAVRATSGSTYTTWGCSG